MPFPLRRPADGDWETLRFNTDAIARRLNPVLPQARVYNNAAISVANATLQALTFNSERFDSGGMHSTTGNTSRLTVPITGLYLIGATLGWDANATGYRGLHFRINGATYIATNMTASVTAARPVFHATTTLYQLAASEYVEAVVEQGSGGALNVQASGNYSPEFWMVRLGGYVNMGV